MVYGNPHPGVLVIRLVVLNLLQNIVLKLFVNILFHLCLAFVDGISLHYLLYSLILLEKVELRSHFVMVFYLA